MGSKKISSRKAPKRKIPKYKKPKSKKPKKPKWVPPKIIKLDSPEFIALQNKWYDKIKEDGFQDLEWLDKRSGKGQNSDFLREGLVTSRTYRPDKEFYFNMCRNFLAHNRLKGMELFLFKNFAEGLSYREIRALLEARGKKRSLFFVFYRLGKIIERCEKWNREHPEGLLSDEQEYLRSKEPIY